MPIYECSDVTALRTYENEATKRPNDEPTHMHGRNQQKSNVLRSLPTSAVAPRVPDSKKRFFLLHRNSSYARKEKTTGLHRPSQSRSNGEWNHRAKKNCLRGTSEKDKVAKDVASPHLFFLFSPHMSATHD